MGGRSSIWHGRHRVVTLNTIVIVLLCVLASSAVAGVSFAAASASPSPADETLTLRLGWSESPLNLNPFIGYSNSYEVWLLNYDTLVAVGADGLPSKETGLAED
jgi:ABC-type transport system substrate-binding protein